jgi:hypothetical protein
MELVDCTVNIRRHSDSLLDKTVGLEFKFLNWTKNCFPPSPASLVFPLGNEVVVFVFDVFPQLFPVPE